MSFRQIEGPNIPKHHPVDLYATYFAGKQTSQGWMCAQDHDPIHVPKLMPWVMVLERADMRVGQTDQYRYRFFGTECVELAQCDLTGHLLGERIEPRAEQYRRREFDQVKAVRTPLFARGSMPIDGRSFQQVLTGVFPVSARPQTGIDRFHVVVAPVRARLAS